MVTLEIFILLVITISTAIGFDNFYKKQDCENNQKLWLESKCVDIKRSKGSVNKTRK